MLYNIKKSFATHHIHEDGHKIYFEEYGKKNGIPILFLHGGPGSGCNPSQRSLFNSEKFRVIFLDQRGSGKSIPKGSIINNTTQLIIEDIERIREYLNISSWNIVGGSWGSTLAIAYAELHPSRINAMVLRSLFLATKEEINWAFFQAPLTFRPELIYKINVVLKNRVIINPIKKLGVMLEAKNINKRCLAAELWLAYESNLSKIIYNEENIEKIYNNKVFSKKRINGMPNTPFIEWHYIKNNFFLKNNSLLKNKSNIKNTPIAIVQSDYDLLCPPRVSYNFCEGLNKSKIFRVAKAGHYVSDPGVKEKMRELIDKVF